MAKNKTTRNGIPHRATTSNSAAGTTETARARREASTERDQSSAVQKGFTSISRRNAPNSEADSHCHGCVVVGVGASAGGLDAYKQLLRQMPSDSGLAFVLVQHLDPTHDSLMVELLSKHTEMPVLQIEDVTPIEPNHVYMIPPNRFVKINDGGLFLDEPVTKRGVRLPIDYFFDSLAEARKERSICIVLTGTGSDGADGLRHVKAEGGMTVVQKPETSDYDGMPRAAINTGAVDFVLPIEEMADVIIPYAQHPYVRAKRDTTLADTAPDHFRAILSLLHAHTDLDFSPYKKGMLTRRIDRRMGIRQVSKPADYLKLLREDNRELRSLCRDLLIGVTQFFRDPGAWDELAEVLAQTVLAKQQDEPFRIWVPGCASGEEAYSAAMLIFQQQQRHDRRLDVHVFATDIDAGAIDNARLGFYPEGIVKNLTDTCLDAYFHREGDKLRVAKKLRESCIFAVQNLLSDPPFSNLDLICCRNLLIYLEPETQHRVFDMLHFALKPQGLLFLGASESITRRKHLFEVVSQSSRIYRKVGESVPGSSGFPIGSSNEPLPRDRDATRHTELTAIPSVGTATVERSKRALLSEYAPASVVVNHRGLIQYIHGSVRNYLDFPSGEPELDLCDLAQQGLKAKVRTALHQARTSNETVSVVAPRVQRNDVHVAVRLRVHPLPTTKGSEPLYLVSFLDESMPVAPDDVNAAIVLETGDPKTTGTAQAASSLSERQLELELQSTREDLQSTIEDLESANEELKASNEEVMSMNEELQSTNEELQTSREELQSLNEELSTVNSQLHDKVEELEATTDDLTNLLTSTDMATLFLDGDLRIRRFTPATMRLMSLLDTDIGRPLIDLAPRVEDPDLVSDAMEVLQKLTPVQKQVRDGAGRHYMRRITPFRTSDNKIEGVVITFSDVTQIKVASQRVEFRERQQAVIAQLGRRALVGEPLDSLFDQTVQTVAETLQVDFCKLLRLLPDRKDFLLVAGVGWQEGLVGNAIVPNRLNSQASYTLQRRGPVIVDELQKERRFRGPDLLTQHGVVSGMSVIVGPETDPWGVLGIHASRRVEFTIDDTNFIQAVANVLWEAIERERHEAALRENEARTATFLSSSAVAGWMKDNQGKYVFWSESCARRFKLPGEDVLGKTDDEIWPPDVADQLQTNDKRVLNEGASTEVIEEVVDASGRRAQFLVSKFPFVNEAGSQFVGGIGVDITQRIQAEEALADSEERLRLAARMAGFGTYYIDLETNEFNWSPELRRIFGMNRDELAAFPVGGIPEFIHDEDRERVAEKLKASLDPESDGEFYDEFRILRADGQLRWILMQGRTMFRGKGAKRRPTRVAGVALDFTERHKSEEELQEARKAAEAANEAKSIFLANMSHEIRTPMTAILGYADVLATRLKDADAKACIRTIKDNGNYLCDILNDILDLSKIESGKLTVRRESVSILNILSDIRSLMAVRATEKSLILSLEFDGEIPETIESDRKMVRQILVNLVGNAIKFTDEGGVRILTRCIRDDELLEISVIDTGIGIDMDQMESLFLPFEQLDNSFTRTTSGSGLGLAISKKLTEILGGKLKVESKVNEGSVFCFTIRTGPLQEATWVAPDPAALREVDTEVTLDQLPRINGRILAVDDRREIRFLVREFVESAGGQVEAVENGTEGVERCLAGLEAGAPPDAILMDMQMPGMDGLEATKKLRAEGYQGPIIALTANAMRRDRDRCLEAGCNDFVAKPIDRAVLVQKLADEMNRQPTDEHKNARQGLKVLCVDDHEATCYSQKLLLEQQGYRVETATSGEEALLVLENFTPDVGLLDLSLHDMTGSELLAQLQTRPALAKCRFICFSGKLEDAVPWREMGFSEFLQKPADLDDIQRVIDRVR